MRVLLLCMIVLLPGCGKMDRVFDWLSGTKTNLVVLEERPFVLSDKPSTWTPSEPMTVVGKEFGMCFVLATGVDLPDQKVMDSTFESALKGATITVTLKFKGAPELTVPVENRAWSLYGNAGKEKEFSACSGCNCASVPVGTPVESVSAVATQPVLLQAAYWKSTDAFDAPGT